MSPALLLLGLSGGPAHAFELVGTGPLAGATVQVTDDFELRYHQTDRRLPGFEDRRIHDYVEQVNRLNLLLSQRWDSGDALTAGVQLDEVALFSNRYILDGTLYHSWDLLGDGVASPWQDAFVELEKGYLTFRGREAELTLGDGYASFGRGIALNIKKNSDIDIDTSIRGAKGTLRLGDTELMVVSGITNEQQVSHDQPNIGIERDLSNMVTGLRLDRYGIGPANAGLHGVVYRFGRGADQGVDPWARYAEPLDAVVGGANLELLGVGGIDWYAEGDVFAYLNPEMVGQVADADQDFQPVVGHVAYASGSAYPGQAVVLVEAKHSSDSERINSFVTAEGWEVATVPTMEYERVITEDSAAAVNSNDIWGGRVRVDYSAAQGLVVPYVSVAALRDSDVDVLHFNRSPETVVHPLAGLQWTGTGVTAQLNTGLRLDVRDDAAEGQDRLVHGDGDLSIPITGKDHLELAVAVKHFAWGDNVQQQADFMEMENALAWHRGEKLVFILYQDWSDNPLVQSEGNLAEKLYGAAEVSWEPATNLTLRAFYGAYKAGIRCSGGQCRSLPGFEGARLAMTGTF
ncbi:hypothetical protein L6R53_18355 [Myxococcota bacterium]|nr:hypothetical protein [Myxococcota bacterium]